MLKQGTSLTLALLPVVNGSNVCAKESVRVSHRSGISATSSKEVTDFLYV